MGTVLSCLFQLCFWVLNFANSKPIINKLTFFPRSCDYMASNLRRENLIAAVEKSRKSIFLSYSWKSCNSYSLWWKLTNLHFQIFQVWCSYILWPLWSQIFVCFALSLTVSKNINKYSKLYLSWPLSEAWLVRQGHLTIDFIYILILKDLKSFMKF